MQLKWRVKEKPDDCDDFCAGTFKPISAPILQRPSPPPTRKPRRRAAAAPTRSSTRQAAQASSLPVAERAQYKLKLMRELSFIDGKSAAPTTDAAVTAYIDMYGHDLPEQAVKTIQAAARLNDKVLFRALAAIAAESGALEMETL